MRQQYNGRGGVRSFVIDDLDRCVQSMSRIEIKAVSLNGNPITASSPLGSSTQ